MVSHCQKRSSRFQPRLQTTFVVCDPEQNLFCKNILAPDGQLDTGFYYAQGGTFKYDAFSLQLGIRYTF